MARQVLQTVTFPLFHQQETWLVGKACPSKEAKQPIVMGLLLLTNWKGCTNKRQWPILRWYRSIFRRNWVKLRLYLNFLSTKKQFQTHSHGIQLLWNCSLDAWWNNVLNITRKPTHCIEALNFQTAISKYFLRNKWHILYITDSSLFHPISVHIRTCMYSKQYKMVSLRQMCFN